MDHKDYFLEIKEIEKLLMLILIINMKIIQQEMIKQQVKSTNK